MKTQSIFKAFVGVSIAVSPLNCYSAIIVEQRQDATILNYFGTNELASGPSATDLVNTGRSTLHSKTTLGTSPASGWSVNALNDGTAPSADVVASATYWPTFNTGIVFNLNTSIAPFGYDLTTIRTFFGWQNGSNAQANQLYDVVVRKVGSTLYTPLISVRYQHFPDANLFPVYNTRVTLTDTTGKLATGVDSIAFTFLAPSVATGNGSGVVDQGGTAKGTVIREIDVFGQATIPEPSMAMLSALGLISVLGLRRRS